MINVFVGGRMKGMPHIPLLYPNLGTLNDDRHLFADRGFRAFTRKVVEIINDPATADFIILPHDYFYVLDRTPELLTEYCALARQYKKKLLVFDFSDYSERVIDMPNAWIFRVAGYRHHWKENEIMMPYFIEDLAQGRELLLRGKKEVPRIGFCGWADFKDQRSAYKAWVKRAYFALRNFLAGDSDVGAHTQGLFLRRQAIRVLERSRSVWTNFIIRTTYGSHKDTLELSPHEARRQYIENMEGSDLALAVRGDSNFSQRFYEALSLGRIPLLIDTDCVLPLANTLHYDDFMLRIGYKDISSSDRIVAEWYRSVSPEDFKKMQQRAREAFENYLEAGAFFAYILPKLK